MDKAKMLSDLTRLDFMAMDVMLYLDTHPDCAKGLNLYDRITAEAKRVRDAYEAGYGAIRSYGCQNPPGESWMWICEPYPWQANNEAYI